MKILLVNPNTFRNPPVIPIGLEYLADALERAGHEVTLADLTFEDSPLAALSRRMAGESFDLAGVTVRNIDTAQAARCDSFMPGIRDVVSALRGAGLPVALGGAGFTGMPEAILQYTEAHYGIYGPAEVALPELCKEFAKPPTPGKARLYSGWSYGLGHDVVRKRAVHVDYEPYLKHGGIAGFATQYGCPGNCLYCMEKRTPLTLRNPAAVVGEIKALHAKGVMDFHLCDSEFNHDPEHCLAFLRKLREADLEGLRWTAYMKATPPDQELLFQMSISGVYMVTLNVDSAVPLSTEAAYRWDDISALYGAFKAARMELVVDLSIGLPDEPDHSSEYAFQFFRGYRPTKVNVNAWYRVYGGTRLEELLRGRPDLHKYLSVPLPYGPPLLEPLIYNHIPRERVVELIDNDPLFKLEGFDPGVNYEIV